MGFTRAMTSPIFRTSISFITTFLLLFVGQTQVAAVEDGCSTGFDSGSGSEADPYMITNVAEFKEIEDCTDSFTYFEIAQDIDFGGNEPGTGISELNGQLDGAGFSLKNVFVDTPVTGGVGGEYFGLFAEADGSGGQNSAIKNVTFENPKIIPSETADLAGVIGYTNAGVSVQDVTVRGAQIGSTNNQAERSGILFGEVAYSSNQADISNLNLQGELHCGIFCGGLAGLLGVSSGGDIDLSNINASVEMKTSNSNTLFGGLFGYLSLGNSSTSLADVSVSVEGTGSVDNVGGIVGLFYVSNTGASSHDFERLSVSGSLPQATNQGGVVGEYELYKDLTVDYGETVVGASFGTGSTNSRLLVGNQSLNSGATVSNNLSAAEVFHSTSFSEHSEYLPETNSGGTFTKIDSADRSTLATYSSFDITNNLSTSADWYVQEEDSKGELFGGYPVPYSLANATYFGPRYFFKPNGATGTDIGRIGVGVANVLEVISNPFSRSGFDFAGWNNKANGTGDFFQIGSAIYGQDNASIFAIWNELYDTTFDANTADSGSVAPILDENSITVPGAGDLEKEGFEFTGWNTQADGEGTSYAEGDTLNLTSNITLFAQWQQSQTSPPPYSGPLITSVGSGSTINASSTETIRVSGERLGSVSGVSVDGKEATVVSVATDHFMMTLPEGLASGTYDLDVQSSIGNLTYLDAITVAGIAQEVEASEQGFGEVSAWTKRISDSQAKVYVKYPTVGEKVRISHQTGGSGDYNTVYVKTTSSETMEGLRVVEGVGTYIVRTINLSNINRIRVTVGNQEMVQVRYNN